MPRNGKHRGDKHSPFGAAAQRRKSATRRLAVAERAPKFVSAASIKEFMADYSDEDEGTCTLSVGGVQIECNENGGIRHVRRERSKAAASGSAYGHLRDKPNKHQSPALQRSRSGISENTAFPEEESSESSSDVDSEIAAELAAQLAEHSSEGSDYEGLVNAMRHFGASEIGADVFPEDAISRGLDGGGSGSSLSASEVGGAYNGNSSDSSSSSSSSSNSDSSGGSRCRHSAKECWSWDQGRGARLSDVGLGDIRDPSWELPGMPRASGRRRKGAAGKVASGNVQQQKKARKAALRAARAEKRGFDLGAVNVLLRDFVLDDGDLLGLPTKVGRAEAAAVHRLASLYGLKCKAQGGGKKCTIMVTTTKRTAVADPDEVAAMLVTHTRMVDRGARSGKLPPGSQPAGAKQMPRQRHIPPARTGRRASKAAPDVPKEPPVPAYLQPVAFVSSGVMFPADDEVEGRDPCEPPTIPSVSADAHEGAKPAGASSSSVISDSVWAPLDEEAAAEPDELSSTPGLGAHAGLGFAPSSDMPFKSRPSHHAAFVPAQQPISTFVASTSQPRETAPAQDGSAASDLHGGTSIENHTPTDGAASEMTPSDSQTAISDMQRQSDRKAVVDRGATSWSADSPTVAFHRPFPFGLGFARPAEEGTAVLETSTQPGSLGGHTPLTPAEVHSRQSMDESSNTLAPTVLGLHGSAADEAAVARGLEDAAVDAEEPAPHFQFNFAGPSANVPAQQPLTFTSRPGQALQGRQERQQRRQQRQQPGTPGMPSDRQSGTPEGSSGWQPVLSGTHSDNQQRDSPNEAEGLASGTNHALSNGDAPDDPMPTPPAQLFRRTDKNNSQSACKQLPESQTASSVPNTPQTDAHTSRSSTSGAVTVTAAISAASLADPPSAAARAPDESPSIAANGKVCQDSQGMVAHLMSPNGTKKQVTAARKKEAKLLRRLQRGVSAPDHAVGLGVTVSDPIESDNAFATGTPARSNVTAKFGGFERHTTGFGSRMLAKMGFAGMGAGLGRGEQGIAEPIAAVPRAKNLGIGAG